MVVRARTVRCARSTTSAGTAATSWCGGLPARGDERHRRQFTCKYHGWRYGLDGACAFVQQEGEFFDLDKADYGLVPVHCDVFAGFIFVNFARDAEPVTARLSRPHAPRHRGLPVPRDDRALRLTGWSAAPTGRSSRTPSWSSTTRPCCTSALRAVAAPAQRDGFEAPHYQIEGPHRVVTTARASSAWKYAAGERQADRHVTRSGLFGPWEHPRSGELPPGINPARCSRGAYRRSSSSRTSRS